MGTPKRKLAWAEMNHDDELLWEVVVGRAGLTERGPIPEFLAKKRAEQEPKTHLGYKTALSRFRDFLGPDATVGQLDETAGHRFLTYLKETGLSENSVATYFRSLKAFTNWMNRKGWTERVNRPGKSGDSGV